MVSIWSDLSLKGQVIVGVAAVCGSAAVAVWIWKRSKKSPQMQDAVPSSSHEPNTSPEWAASQHSSSKEGVLRLTRGVIADGVAAVCVSAVCRSAVCRSAVCVSAVCGSAAVAVWIWKRSKKSPQMQDAVPSSSHEPNTSPEWAVSEEGPGASGEEGITAVMEGTASQHSSSKEGVLRQTRDVITGVMAAVCRSAAVALGMWKRSKKSSQHSSSKEGQNQDSDEVKAKPHLLEKTNEELDNEVYKMNMFLCLRRLLENHRELFKLQLEDVEREREDNKEKIQSVEKLITESEREKTTEKTEELLREKQKLLSAQWKLERRKEELEKVQLNTEKVLQSEEADGLLNRMTERKQNLEKGGI
ncbi:uncharacterized protein LOC115589809 [Sparus aurata]|uniref:uncharacterized protein LOC115589809 n=1 Tax=Sparus aurata TaxID=8175 RepID=UPI0011C11031|nr:uncharacterized protein LOC115589809 [Sparus aurata]